MPKPGGSKIEGRLPVGKRTHDAGASPDLSQHALKRIVGANPPPVLLREGVVGQRLLNCRLGELGRPGQAQRLQLLNHSSSLLTRRHHVLTGMDRLEHGRDLPHLGRGYMTEDIAVPMHDTALPHRVGEKLRGAFGKPDAGIRGDQPDPFQATLLEVLEERTPARLVLLRPLTNAENLPISLAIHPNRNQQRDDTRVPHNASVMSSTRRTETPERY